MAVIFSLVRIDDRLIHGQVAVGWTKAVLPQELIVANDQAVADPMQKGMMEMAASPNFGVTVCSVREVAEVCGQTALNGKRVLVLFSTPQDALRACDAGLGFSALNVGGMRYSAGKRQISPAVAVDARDAETFRELIRRGIRVTIQMVPTDEAQVIEKYL